MRRSKQLQQHKKDNIYILIKNKATHTHTYTYSEWKFWSLPQNGNKNVNKNWTLQQRVPNWKSTAQQQYTHTAFSFRQKENATHTHSPTDCDVEEREICELNAIFFWLLFVACLFCWIDMHPPKWVISVHKSLCQKNDFQFFNFKDEKPWNGFSFEKSLHLQREYRVPCAFGGGTRVRAHISFKFNLVCVCVSSNQNGHLNVLYLRHSRDAR